MTISVRPDAAATGATATRPARILSTTARPKRSAAPVASADLTCAPAPAARKVGESFAFQRFRDIAGRVVVSIQAAGASCTHGCRPRDRARRFSWGSDDRRKTVRDDQKRVHGPVHEEIVY